MKYLLSFLFVLLSSSVVFGQQVIFVSPDRGSTVDKASIRVGSYGVSSLALYAVRGQSLAVSKEGTGLWSSAFVIMDSLVDSVSFSLVDELQFRFMKRDFFDEYLVNLRSVLQQATLLHQRVRDTMDNHDIERLRCIDEKRLADNAFVFAFARHDVLGVTQGVEDATQADRCAVEHRIQINAYRALESKLGYYLSLGEQKHTILFENFETILEFHPVMDQELLRLLQELTKRIHQR